MGGERLALFRRGASRPTRAKLMKALSRNPNIMAEVIPFVGTRYDVSRVGGLGAVATPPYDVITPEMQEAFYARHPNNIVRIDCGKSFEGDDETDNKYTRAAAALAEWRAQNLLTLDERPTFTVYEQTYNLPDGEERCRRGFFGLVKLEDLDAGGIHAHEQTFDGPVSDRFKLLCATECNTSPIFCLYSDPEKKADKILEREAAREPWAEFTDEEGVRHRAWIVGAEKTCRALAEVLADKELFIADGHHRYETALRRQAQLRSQLNVSDHAQPFDYTFMYLANAEDKGVTVLPIHRALAPEMDDGVDPEEFFEDLREHFLLKKLKIDITKEGAGAAIMQRVAEMGAQKPAFGIVLRSGQAVVAKFRGGVKRGDIIARKIPMAIRALDVTLLHEVIIRQAWVGNPEMEFDDRDIQYFKDPEAAIQQLPKRKACAVFLMNPATLPQIIKIARAGHRMPHKSTYFYPKVFTGLVMREMHMR
ncbi:MAG: hypothetical protein BWZ10_00189 [candidate division BRC1 bacterium ADurb.BinA364]|nr:MAG: hypothetical protein BWZ10_00189 [candidate division BRC1 bacterium ADurb.BinA364]